MYFLPVTKRDILVFFCLLSRASSRKRRCTFIPSLNSCKECISKDAKCSLSDQSGTLADKPRGTRRPLLPLQQGSAILPGLHKGAVTSPQAICDTPDHELITELVALYFDLIHDKQHILFHPPSFLVQYHAGQVTDFLIWAMAALASRWVSSMEFYWHLLTSAPLASLIMHALRQYREESEAVPG